MSASRFGFTSTVFALALASVAAAQTAPAPSPIVTDRPGFLFSSLTVGRGTVQIEAGLPTVTQVNGDGFDLRTTSGVGLLRVGVTEDFELRLGPVYNRVDVDFDQDGSSHDEGYGDLEVGAKWHLLDGEGARPSLALISSVILPVSEDGFSAEEPAYLLNLAAEWTLPSGTGIAGLAGVKRGELSDGDTFIEETLGLAAGRTFGAWSPYGEIAWMTNDLPGSPSAGYLGGGIKYLATNDFQLDFNFDRGVTDDAADWLFGFGLAGRF